MDIGLQQSSVMTGSVAAPPRERLVERLAQQWRGVAPTVEVVPETASWGWLPPLSIVIGIGLLLVAIADTGARTGAAWAEPLLWAGLVVIFGPAAMRLFYSTISAREALGLVVVLALGLYFVKIMYSPTAFIFHDEFLHWRTAMGIQSTGHLFTPNSLFPIGAVFPGLEIVTTALSEVSGLTLFGSAILVIGVARLVLMLSLFLLYRHVSRSTQVAAIACVIYMTNPNFLFFDVVFSYESLAIGLAALFLFAMVRRQGGQPAVQWGLTGFSVLMLAALVASHHITSYAIAGFLILWMITDYYRGRESKDKPGPGGIAPLAVLFCLAWLLLVARQTIGYLGPDLWGAISQLGDMLSSDQSTGTTRQLFQQTGSGEVAPIWERVTAFGAVGLLLLGLPWGFWQIWIRRNIDSAITFAFAATAAAYPVSLIFRLTPRGWEASNRSSEFIFVGVSFVVALGLGGLWQHARANWKLPALLGALACVCFVGGVIAGWPPEWRLPGPYLIISTTAGGARTVEKKGITAAEWTRAYLGTGNHVGSDQNNDLLMATYGGQEIETTLSGGINANWVLYSPTLTPDLVQLLKQGRAQYLVVDHRQVQAPSLARNYYPGVNMAQALNKFDNVQGISRVFDDGDIVIYRVDSLYSAAK